jgi:hypothetical protein
LPHRCHQSNYHRRSDWKYPLELAPAPLRSQPPRQRVLPVGRRSPHRRREGAVRAGRRAVRAVSPPAMAEQLYRSPEAPYVSGSSPRSGDQLSINQPVAGSIPAVGPREIPRICGEFPVRTRARQRAPHRVVPPFLPPFGSRRPFRLARARSSTDQSRDGSGKLTPEPPGRRRTRRGPPRRPPSGPTAPSRTTSWARRRRRGWRRRCCGG